jgi:hypothetical protein
MREAGEARARFGLARSECEKYEGLQLRPTRKRTGIVLLCDPFSSKHKILLNCRYLKDMGFLKGHYGETLAAPAYQTSVFSTRSRPAKELSNGQRQKQESADGRLSSAWLRRDAGSHGHKAEGVVVSVVATMKNELWARILYLTPPYQAALLHATNPSRRTSFLARSSGF